MEYPKRLIEVDLPIKRISAHARREKSIRHGHISTLHIWWARRPLAACRAVICASLWPDPADPLCPQSFRDSAAGILSRFAESVYNKAALHASASVESFGQWEGIVLGAREGLAFDTTDPIHLNKLRFALLDFIADFANWDNSTVAEYLQASRALTRAAHESLGGAPGTRPLVVDPFAGGGSIPLEALRVGADAFASDLNPIPVLLNKVVLEYIPKYGHCLADDVRKWGEWIKSETEKKLSKFYPKDADGATPIAYLWARTIQCEGPGCGAEVPLIRSLWLAKKANRSVGLKLKANHEANRVDFHIIAKQSDEWVYQSDPRIKIENPKFDGTVRRGSATCPCCSYTTPVVRVRQQLKMRRGGINDSVLFAVVTTQANTNGRAYRIATDEDRKAFDAAKTLIQHEIHTDHEEPSLVPSEKFTGIEPRRIPLPQYGIEGFGDMFSPRQLLAITTLIQNAKRAYDHVNLLHDTDYSKVIGTLLAFAVDRTVDQSTTLVLWASTIEVVKSTFGRQALPMTWDYVEAQPLAGAAADFRGAIEWIAKVCEHCSASDLQQGNAERTSATKHSLPDDTADAVITDPPYYYSVPYSDLSDFFYVWLRRCIGRLHPDLFQTSLTPKELEVVQNLPHSQVAHLQKSRLFYEEHMRLSMSEARRIAKPQSVNVVVFAHTETNAWESMLSALIESGWMITGSWPIDTEREARTVAQRQSTLASSVHLVCRPREHPDGSVRTNEIGDWRDVLHELPRRIHEWMPRLAEEGVVGADAIFSCLGPALEVFSRYSRVEKASGEAVSLKDYLEEVWAAVSNEALSLIFKEADTGGLEPDARLTAMWLWTLSTSGTDPDEALTSEEETEEDATDADDEETGGRAAKGEGFSLEFDAARKIAQGLGANLEDLRTVVEVKGKTARLLSVSERARSLFGKGEGPGVTVPKKSRGRAGFLKGMEDAGSPIPTSESWDELGAPRPGATALDRVHQAMILFGRGQAEALKRFVVEEGAGTDARFWKLAQSLSALYPPGTNEKRWVDGVLARKKGLGF